MSFEIAELNRQFNNFARIGTVHSVDYEQNTARVEFGTVVTDYLPWLTTRAAGNRTYNSLEIGEQVFVITPPGQSLGVIVGVLNQTAHPAPDHSSDIQKTIYKDGSVIEYDRAKHVLTADVKGDVKVLATESVSVDATKNIVANAGADITATASNVTVKANSAVTITGGSSVTVNAPQITLNGVTMINGPLTQGGGSGGGNAKFNGSLHTTDTISTDSDVVATVSLNGHTHSCREGGTGSPS